MFQFPGLALPRLCIQRGITAEAVGFPHSDIDGSRSVCLSPSLIAACRVLHRLLMPRHPPCTLSSLTNAHVVRLPVALNFQTSIRVWRLTHYGVVKEQYLLIMGAEGIEPSTPALSGLCSATELCARNRIMELTRFERATPCLQSRCSPS